MPSTKANTINQYCSVCKETYDMEVVKQGSSKSVIWLKCPGCQGFLPYMSDDSDEVDDSKQQGESDELALEEALHEAVCRDTDFEGFAACAVAAIWSVRAHPLT